MPTDLREAPRAGLYPTSGPSLMGSIDAPLPQTLGALTADSDVIALVEPETQLPDMWDFNGIIVTSRYRAQVVKVIKGDVAPGDVITLHANGGTMAATFAATSSQRPVPGEPTRILQYVDSPFYHIGVQELVFLVRVYSTDPAIGTIYWADGPGARYNVADGRLVSIFPPEVKASISEGGAIRNEVEGLTLDELGARVGR